MIDARMLTDDEIAVLLDIDPHRYMGAKGAALDIVDAAKTEKERRRTEWTVIANGESFAVQAEDVPHAVRKYTSIEDDDGNYTRDAADITSVTRVIADGTDEKA